MAAFTEAERVQIRRWLGFPAIFTQADPRLESAITSVQSQADGGSRPDDTTAVAIRSYVAELENILEQIKVRREQIEADKVDELRIDTVRGNYALRSEGRMYIGFLSDALATPPRRDVFCPPDISPGGSVY